MKTAYYDFDKKFPKQFYLYFTFTFKINLYVSAYHDRRLCYKQQTNKLFIQTCLIKIIHTQDVQRIRQNVLHYIVSIEHKQA
jgi:hypothetical protein